jgi:amino acid transporter
MATNSRKKAARPPPRPPVVRRSGVTWTALAMMAVSSVASLRPAPTMAVYGLACVFPYVLPAIVFLIPTALVSAELATGSDGGIYRWVKEGMSPKMASPRTASTPR